MKLASAMAVSLLFTLLGRAQEPPPGEFAPPAAASTPETERVQAAEALPADQRGAIVGEGSLEPEQVRALLHRIWLAEYRTNDLLTEVQPDRWKLEEAPRKSFLQILAALQSQLEALASWRSQFEQRPDSAYLGFMTYATIAGILPRLDGVGRSIAQHENVSLGAQFSQAGNQLFDLQQALQPYLAFLFRNHDELFYAVQSNLANCQNELSFAMRGRTETPTLMKNVAPDFKGRRKRSGGLPPAAGPKTP
jgi:hypothetical protein